jgi:hypothetical protein
MRPKSYIHSKQLQLVVRAKDPSYLDFGQGPRQLRPFLLQKDFPVGNDPQALDQAITVFLFRIIGDRQRFIGFHNTPRQGSLNQGTNGGRLLRPACAQCLEATNQSVHILGGKAELKGGLADANQACVVVSDAALLFEISQKGEGLRQLSCRSQGFGLRNFLIRLRRPVDLFF